MRACPDVILPFPGGIARSGSKVGSKYKALRASTNTAFAPTLRGLVDDRPARRGRLRLRDRHRRPDPRGRRARHGRRPPRGVRARDRRRSPPGNYGGKLGPFHIRLRRRRRSSAILTVGPMPLILRWRDATTLARRGRGLTPEAFLGRCRRPSGRAGRPRRQRAAELGDLFAVEGDGSDDGLTSRRRPPAGPRARPGDGRGDADDPGRRRAGARGGDDGRDDRGRGAAGDWAGAEMRGGPAADPGRRRAVRSGRPTRGAGSGCARGSSWSTGDVGRRRRAGDAPGPDRGRGAASGDGLGRGMIAGSIFALRAGRPAGRGGDEAGDARPVRAADRRPSCCRRSRRAGVTGLPFLTIYLRQLAALGFPVPGALSRPARAVQWRPRGRGPGRGPGRVGAGRTRADDGDGPERAGAPAWSRRSWAAPRSGEVAAHPIEEGGRFVDCGIEARGGLPAGLDLARVCLADLAEVAIVPGEVGGPAVPARAGRRPTTRSRPAWRASTPAGRSARGSSSRWARARCARRRARSRSSRRSATARTPRRSSASSKTRKPPTPAVVAKIAEACRVAPVGRDPARGPDGEPGGRRSGRRAVGRDGPAQARRAGFDLGRVVSAHGTAPLPPVAADDLAAIGRTNDAILYGARVVLYVTGDDASLERGRPAGPVVRLARPRRAVRRDLRPLQPRLLRRRPPPVQPGRGRLPEPRDRPRPRLRRRRRTTSSSAPSSA